MIAVVVSDTGLLWLQLQWHLTETARGARNVYLNRTTLLARSVAGEMAESVACTVRCATRRRGAVKRSSAVVAVVVSDTIAMVAPGGRCLGQRVVRGAGTCT